MLTPKMPLDGRILGAAWTDLHKSMWGIRALVEIALVVAVVAPDLVGVDSNLPDVGRVWRFLCKNPSSGGAHVAEHCPSEGGAHVKERMWSAVLKRMGLPNLD